MGYTLRGVERVTLRELSMYARSPVILGMDSAISYHGYGTDDYKEYPILVTDKLPVGCWLNSDPTMAGVRSVQNAEPTEWKNVLVTPLVEALLDTMEYNKYSEQIVNALMELENDAFLCRNLEVAAKERGLSDLLEWEWKETRDYFNR